MVEIDVSYGSSKRDDRPADPVDPGSMGDSFHPNRRREPRSRLSQPESERPAEDRTPLHGRPVERSAAADAIASATTPHGRAGCNPFSPGPPQPPAEDVPGGWPTDLPSTLYVLIVQQWTQTLAGPFDWANWPLDRYFFSDAFLRDLEGLADLDNVAWVCAMVACGLAHEFSELKVEPRSSGPAGDELVREDGAKGRRCSIMSGRGMGARLDFWRLPSGVIEFDAFMAIHLVQGREPGSGAC